jgi:hypothetical protein
VSGEIISEARKLLHWSNTLTAKSRIIRLWDLLRISNFLKVGAKVALGIKCMYIRYTIL